MSAVLWQPPQQGRHLDGHLAQANPTLIDGAMTYEPPAGILIGPEAMREVKAGDAIAALMPERFAEVHDLGKGMHGPTIVPVGIVRASDPTVDTSFTQVFNVWIIPEIDKRAKAGSQTDSLLPLSQALIVFPPKDSPERHRVLLNSEVGVRAALRPSYTDVFSEAIAGDKVELRLGDMFDLRGFALEGVDMENDGFVWMRPERGGWALYFNFIPSSGAAMDISPGERERVMRSVQDAIAQEMLQTFLHGVIGDDDDIRRAMTSDGWCPTPILLPEPWQRMIAAYVQGEPEGATELALCAVGVKELDKMRTAWLTEDVFASDRPFLDTGIERYSAGDYISAISVLLPRIEGLANRVRQKRGAGARDNVTQVFGELDKLASADVRDGYLATRIREEFASFITNFLLVHFKPSSSTSGAVRGRHAHAHGATGDPQYDRGYALKIILALDALYFISR